MQETMIRQLELENGLTLEVFERSRKVALDRYFISMIARMTIAVDAKWFDPSPQAAQEARKIASALGQSLVFEKTLDRNFVDAADKDKIVADFCHSMVNHMAKYYARPDFPKKFILRQYETYLKQKAHAR